MFGGTVGNGVSLIPLEVIDEAVNGNLEALEYILHIYDNYINALCVRPLVIDSNITVYTVDEDMKMRLKSKLIAAILTFSME